MNIKPLWRLLTSLLLIISGCGSDTSEDNSSNHMRIPDRESIAGHWVLEYDNDCRETYGFSNDGELIVRSNEEYVLAEYVDIPFEQSRNALVISLIYDNGGIDCEGFSENDSAADPIEIYYVLSGNSMLWYDSPESTNALATLEFIPQSFENFQTDGVNLSINSVTPSVLTIGENTEVTVSISYSLPNLDDSYSFHVGTNKKFMNMVYADQDFELSQTSGEITISIPTQAYDWGSESAFFLSAWIFKNKDTALEQPAVDNFVFELTR